MASEEIRQKIDSLERAFDKVLESVHLNDLREEVARLDNDIHALDERIAKTRSMGYAFDASLEARAQDLIHRWEEKASEIQREITRQSSRLQGKLPGLKMRIGQLRRGTPTSSQVTQTEAEIDDFTHEIEAAQEAIQSVYSGMQQAYWALHNQINRIEWMLKQLAEASFSLLETESGVAACKAIWAKDGEEDRKGDPEGILFLTDQRLIFERKEKVATKKVLFIATEKELVQEVLFEAPVAEIEDVQASRKGMLKKDDYITVQFSSRAPLSRVTWHIWGAGADWVQTINRVKSKDLDRVIELDEEIVEKVQNAPSECPSCGATISQTILRGQDTITCEYCGYVIRL